MKIVDRKVEFSTPWFWLISKSIEGEAVAYYALKMADYVSVLVFSPESDLVLVRQYRPAVERYTLELPSGQVEKGESPEQCARREVTEECGLEVVEIEPLGALLSDTGRHENQLWCYVATQTRHLGAKFKPEPGVEPIVIPRAKISEIWQHPEFDHALNYALMMLAVLKNKKVSELFALK